MLTIIAPIFLVAVLSVLAIGNVIRYRRRLTVTRRLMEAVPSRPQISDYSRFDQDQILRNRSERWED